MVQLFVYDAADTSGAFLPKTALTIESYLGNKPNWKPDLNEIILTFDFLSNNINDFMNPFGRLDSIVDQFIELEKRLLENTFAILRTDNHNAASFFILEPQEDEVSFSFLADLPLPYASFFPQVPSPLFYSGKFNQQLELYSYVQQNRDALIPQEIQPAYISQMLNVRAPKREFLNAITRHIHPAKKLLKE
jgi:hypothetical protein